MVSFRRTQWLAMLVVANVAAMSGAEKKPLLTTGITVTINGKSFNSGPGGTLARNGYEISRLLEDTDAYRVVIPRTEKTGLNGLAWYNTTPCTGKAFEGIQAVQFNVEAIVAGRILLKAG